MALKVRVNVGLCDAVTLSVRDGDRSLVFKCGKRVQRVECDSLTQPDQAEYYTRRLLAFIGSGGDLPSLMGCLEVIASDCGSIPEFIEVLGDSTHA